jgi:uncharacterized protein YegL
MSEYDEGLDQVSFGGFEKVAAENPENRCPCLLLLDNSGSMAGEKIQNLNAGIQAFANALQTDSMASKRVRVSMVSFGPVEEVQPFVDAAQFFPLTLATKGATPMGEAILKAIELVDAEKQRYKDNGIGYYRPWIFMISDGAPTDSVVAARAAIQEGEVGKKFSFYAVGVEGADMDTLQSLAHKKPAVSLKGLAFGEMFAWLSDSLSKVSESQLGDQVALDDPRAPGGWAVVESD